MSLSDFSSFARNSARPFTQYVVTVAFAVGMFAHLGFEVLGLAVSLLAWHGYLRTQDKRTELSTAGAGQPDMAPPASDG